MGQYHQPPKTNSNKIHRYCHDAKQVVHARIYGQLRTRPRLPQSHDQGDVMNRQSQSGMTLVELLIAGLLLSGIFLAVTTVHISSLKLLRGQENAAGLDPLIALEHISRNVTVANEVFVDNGTGVPGTTQLKLRIDRGDPGTTVLTDDEWVIYRFINGGLFWRTVIGGGAAAAPNIAVGGAGVAEVVPGLALSTAPLSSFNLTSTNVIKIDLRPAVDRPEPVITTSVMLGQRSR